MKTSVETLEPIKVKLSVEVEPKRVKQAFDRAAKELAKQVNIPGFRPGKAPRRLLEQRFGAGAIAQAAIEDALSTYYLEALQEASIDPVGPPDVDLGTFTEEEGCTFTAVVEVRPSFDPPDHTGIGVTFPEWDVDDEAVDEQLATLQDRFSEVDEVERPAREGDLVTLDLRVILDGEELEAAHVEDALYEVGSGGVTPKLDEELIDAEAGAELTYDDTLPDTYPEHGGAEVTFHVRVKDVREKVRPELDDDFAASASGMDSIDELRADVRNSLLRRRIMEAQHQVRSQIVEAYLARIDVPLPPAMIDAEVQQQLSGLEQQAEQYQMDADDVLTAQGITREEFIAKAQDAAGPKVKAQLVLDRLAETLALPLEAVDLDREIMRHAQATGMDPNELATVIRDQGNLPVLIGDIMRRKAIDAIVEAATVEGAPSHDVLVEVGLEQPAASADAADGGDAAQNTGPADADTDTDADPEQDTGSDAPN